jgi:hypothetical protein
MNKRESPVMLTLIKRRLRMAEELSTKLTSYLVQVLDLRVMVTEEQEGYWFAQGLDVDYAAQGSSWQEVRKAFEDGFMATIDAHLKKFGHLDYFRRQAPQDIWEEYRHAKFQKLFSSISIHLGRAIDRVDIKYQQVDRDAA